MERHFDQVMLDLGLLSSNPGDADPVSGEVIAYLEREFATFLAAGGIVTWEFWRGLSPLSRAAIRTAADRVFSGRQAVVPAEASASSDDEDDGTVLKLINATARVSNRLALGEEKR